MKLADAIKMAKSVKMSHAQKFVQHVVPEVVRPARIIWNQAIGAIFLLFSVLFLGNAVNYHRQMTAADPRRNVALGFSIFLGIVMGFFGVASFWRARKLARPGPTGHDRD